MQQSTAYPPVTVQGAIEGAIVGVGISAIESPVVECKHTHQRGKWLAACVNGNWQARVKGMHLPTLASSTF
jgi:hypothetical protein